MPGRELEVGYESDEDMDLNLLFRESDEAELDPEDNLDDYWEDERSGRSSGQHNSTTGTNTGGSTDTQRVGLAPTVSASEAHLGERSDHLTENNPSARVNQRKRKRGTGRAGTKRRRKRYRPYGPVTVRLLILIYGFPQSSIKC